jgi:hypothetical protein
MISLFSSLRYLFAIDPLIYIHLNLLYNSISHLKLLVILLSYLFLLHSIQISDVKIPHPIQFYPINLSVNIL